MINIFKGSPKYINVGDIIKKSIAKKSIYYGRPKWCSECYEELPPSLHIRIVREGFLRNIEMCKFYEDICIHCGNEFGYWA